jgi:type I restriction enzyme M protein
MKHLEYVQKTKDLIDALKTICANYGLANTGHEYRVITEVFLYKFLNDKFFYEARKANKELKDSKNIEQDLQAMSDKDYEYMLEKIGQRAAKFKKNHFISHLHNNQNKEDFATIFDDTLIDIADLNIKLFSVSTIDGEKIRLFGKISQYIIETKEKTPFCRVIINKLVGFSFEPVFEEKYDFFSSIFEYLIKDYNKDSGQYAEYYTPPAVAKIMSRILVPNDVKSVVLYDPAAGSGSLLLSLAHQIGENKCTIYTQDISQKSSEFLRLNLILNNLVHSLHNVIKGNTLTKPHHKNDDETDLKTFDYVVSNPPFKTDFSDDRETLASAIHKKRFFAGVPNIPKKDKKKMPIYLMFIQHILYSLDKQKGKAAIVVPTVFNTAYSGIEKKIREKLIDEKMLRGVVSMPSNIFATTGTNVSVLFIDKLGDDEKIVLIDASKLGTTIKEGKNQKTLLSQEDEELIINTFNKQESKKDFSVVVSYDEVKEKNYSLSAGQYFDPEIEYTHLTSEEFENKMKEFNTNIVDLFTESKKLEKEVLNKISELKFNE